MAVQLMSPPTNGPPAQPPPVTGDELFAMGDLGRTELVKGAIVYPDTVRAADVAFVSSARMAQVKSQNYLDIAPELVVEVLSPTIVGAI